MKKKCNDILHLDRTKLSNQNINKNYTEILKNSKAIKIENNNFIRDLKNGYCELEIIDKNKTF